MTDEPADTPQVGAPRTDTPQGGTRGPLRRPREGRILGGVAAGLADHLGMDVSIVRILIVVITFVTQGLGLVAYVAAVLIVPSDDDPQPPLARGLSSAATGTDPGGPDRTADPAEAGVAGPATRRDASFWAGVALLVVGAVWLLSSPFGPGWVFGSMFGREVVLAGLLIAFGVALWQSGERRRVTPPPSGAPSAPVGTSDPTSTVRQELAVTTHDPDDANDQTVTSSPSVTATPGDGMPPEPWSPPPVTPRASDVLGRVTLGVATMAAGLLWMLSIAGIGSIGAGHVVAAALLVVGIGLLVGAFVGRARWLIAVGVLLLPLVLAIELVRPVGLAALDLDLREGAGDVRVAPASLEELDETHRLAAGQLVLDLRDVDVDRDTQLSVEVGAGDVEVLLPGDVTAEIHVAVGVGQVRLDDTVVGGLGVERDLRVDTGNGSELLSIDVELGVGQVTVRSNHEDPVHAPPAERAPESDPQALDHPMTLTTAEVR
ncbi:MAG: PspC domain-containing protein [Nitriliruptoraceae bacterium]